MIASQGQKIAHAWLMRHFLFGSIFSTFPQKGHLDELNFWAFSQSSHEVPHLDEINFAQSLSCTVQPKGGVIQQDLRARHNGMVRAAK